MKRLTLAAALLFSLFGAPLVAQAQQAAAPAQTAQKARYVVHAHYAGGGEESESIEATSPEDAKTQMRAKYPGAEDYCASPTPLPLSHPRSKGGKKK